MMLLLLATLSLTGQLAIAHNAYILVFPKSIRPGVPLTCHLTRQSRFPRLVLSASITNYGRVITEDEFSVAEKSYSFKLHVPDNITLSSYRLEVRAKDKFGLQMFYHTYYLTDIIKKMSLFVQTDKAIYKPGQTVQFRVFAIKSDLSVLHEDMDIDIFDPSKNRISQWKNVTSDSGVFQGEMVMSSEPPLGDWSIEVLYGGKEKITKRFTVEEFVLPKFEVTVSTSGFGVMTEAWFSGTVSARYTFGKAVEGNGTLIVKKKHLGYKEKEKSYILNFQINGEYRYQISREELFLALDVTYATTLTVDVNVTETLSENTQSGSSDVQFYTRREKLAFLTGSTYFKPGLQYQAYVLLSDQKDRPLPGNLEVDFSVTFSSANNTNVHGRQINITSPVAKNGLATFAFGVPRNANNMSMVAKYADLSTGKFMDQFRSPTNTYLKLEPVTQNLRSGRNARFRLRSTAPRRTINVLIAGRDGILYTDKIFVEKRKAMFKVALTSDMAPTARMIAYYIRRNGEIVADSIKFNVEGVFENKVKIRFNRRVVKPGKDVSLIVRADPGSQCNVLAVDKSILLLKKGNDVTQGMVEDELLSYEYPKMYPCTSTTCMEKYFYAPIPGQDVSSLFSGTGLNVLTNGILYRYYAPRPSRERTSSSTHYYYYSTTSSRPSTFSSESSSGSTVIPTTTPGQEEDQEEEQQPEPAPAPKVRSLFPDTWIYTNSAIANKKGKCYIRATVPDTITSWVATAFAVHKDTGLGIAPNSASLDVLLKFFIRLELPYSVTRGEQLILKASIFNFFTEDIEVAVLLKSSDCFENIIVTTSYNGTSILDFVQEDQTRDLVIAADSAITVNFPIKPTQLGNCEINIQAISAMASDAVQRQLLVEAEGIEESYTIPYLIEANPNYEFYVEQSITLPEDVVPDSVKIRISVVGDLMGPSISGLTSLLRMPYGCGEQNLISLVPNIFVIDYLDATSNLKEEDLIKGQKYMRAGYQRELRYRHSDGSFSAFGEDDLSGSTWLTAFVVKSFAQARRYIYIDSFIMDKAINWLLNQYDRDTNMFREPGRVIHKEMQGGSATGRTNLVAFTLIALLEAKKTGIQNTRIGLPNADLKINSAGIHKFDAAGGKYFTLVVDSAVASLENEVSNMTNIYELAIVGYALALADSEKVGDVLDKLDTMATTGDGMKYWEAIKEPNNPTSSWRPPYYQSRPRNIETNSYILMTYIVKNDLTNGLKVMKWLLKQRNSQGGFGSTQDTVLGLQALTDVASAVFSPDFDLKIDITTEPDNFNHVFYVTNQNAMLFQTVFVPGSTSVVKITGTGEGVTILQISVTYNVMEDPVIPLFDLSLTTTDETMDSFTLQACFSWLGDDISGMSVMEIGMLSGFTADQFSVTNLGIIKRVEEGENKLILYFDEVPSQTECTTIKFMRTSLVAGSQPAVVKLYDYYDPGNHVFSLYQPTLLRDTNVCDIGAKELGC